MRTARLVALLFVLAIATGYLGLKLLPSFPGNFNEVTAATLVVVASLMFGATGLVSIRRGEFPLVVMIRGNAARILGGFNVLIWATVVAVVLLRYLQVR